VLHVATKSAMRHVNAARTMEAEVHYALTACLADRQDASAMIAR